MRRGIENPRIVLLDCPMEYKKGESMTNMELSKEADFSRVLELEEEAIKLMCDEIIKLKPDIVITEKGISDLAQHYLVKAGITALRRVKKTDNNRIARCSGAALPGQGRHHRTASRQEDGQQPDRPLLRRHHRQPRRRAEGGGCRRRRRSLRDQESRRRVFHLHHRMQETP